ncbi:hypothetical protein LXL04_013030 [Taraxacum kok-saghyz]
MEVNQSRWSIGGEDERGYFGRRQLSGRQLTRIFQRAPQVRARLTGKPLPEGVSREKISPHNEFFVKDLSLVGIELGSFTPCGLLKLGTSSQLSWKSLIHMINILPGAIRDGEVGLRQVWALLALYPNIKTNLIPNE